MSAGSSDSTANPSFRTEWWTPRLAGPVTAAAAIRFTLLTATLARNWTRANGPPSTIGTSNFLETGRNLLLHGQFMLNGVPEVLLTPGYPLFLAITSLHGLPAAAVANVILSVFCVILVWRLARASFGNDRIALVAAWIFAFEPLSVVSSVLLESEYLFLALFLLSMERIADFLHGHRLRVLAAAGLWLAAATFVRPVTYYLPVALAVGLFLFLARIPRLRWKAPAVLLISVLPWLAAWQIRNRIETGYGGFTSAAEINLYLNAAAGVTARVEHRSFIDVQNEFDRYPDLSDTFYQYPAQSLVSMRAEALRVIRAHYGVYLHSCLISMFGTAFNPGAGVFNSLMYPGDPWHIDDLIAYKGPVSGAIALAKAYPWFAAEKAAFVVVLLGLYLFAARGVLRGGLHTANLWLLLSTLLYFLAVAAMGMGPGTEARLRLPIMPIVCILAAAGMWRAKTWRDGQERKEFYKRKVVFEGENVGQL